MAPVARRITKLADDLRPIVEGTGLLTLPTNYQSEARTTFENSLSLREKLRAFLEEEATEMPKEAKTAEALLNNGTKLVSLLQKGLKCFNIL